MPIYRGDGGSAETSNNAIANEVAQDAAAAANSATEAALSASAAAASASAAATSETAAETAETNAETSETNAAASATAAASSATSAASSATTATTQASAASTSATAAATSATSAATSATNASTSATSAASSATTATTKASEAATSATNAATSETNAATSETNAASSATSAATSATNAASSESAAATSETNAASSASSASTSATNAASSASAASTSETNAASSASAASTSATNAATSESNAATSATNAATSATNAATSETNASNSASSAATSATNAATSETNAATSATNAAASYDDFDDRYLGAKASDPTLDNDGDALATGALYFNTGGTGMKVYNGSAWEDIAGTVTSVAMTTPTGLTVSGSPVTGSGTLAVSFTAGYSIPTTTKQGQWDTAYGWGDHASAGYLVANATNSITLSSTVAFDFTSSNGPIGIRWSAGKATTAQVDLVYRTTPETLQFERVSDGNDILMMDPSDLSVTVADCGKFQSVSGQYGSIEIDGSANGGYEGYSIGGRAVFMHNNSSRTGIYNDADNQWIIFGDHNSETNICHAGSVKGYTYSSGWRVTGNLLATSNVYAYYSDERLKDKTGKIENALDKVDAIETFYYTHNDTANELGYEGKDQQVGVSAQSVADVMPEVVHLAPIDNDGEGNSVTGENYQTVDYPRLVPLLLEAIKELRAEVEALKNDASL